MNNRVKPTHLLFPVAMTQRHSIRMGEDSVRFKESCVLALGALSQSCEPGTQP